MNLINLIYKTLNNLIYKTLNRKEEKKSSKDKNIKFIEQNMDMIHKHLSKKLPKDIIKYEIDEFIGIYNKCKTKNCYQSKYLQPGKFYHYCVSCTHVLQLIHSLQWEMTNYETSFDRLELKHNLIKQYKEYKKGY